MDYPIDFLFWRFVEEKNPFWRPGACFLIFMHSFYLPVLGLFHCLGGILHPDLYLCLPSEWIYNNKTNCIDFLYAGARSIRSLQ